MPGEPKASVQDSAAARQRYREVRRRRILDAAAAEFADKGFKGGSMRLIARTLGLELAHIQYHFKDKDSLWDAVLSDVLGEFRRQLDEIFREKADEEPEEIIALAVDRLIRFAATRPHFVSLMARTRSGESREVRPYHREFDESFLAFIALVARAQKKGRFVAGDPVLRFAQLIGAALRIFTATDLGMFLGRSPLDAEVLDEHIRSCIALFIPARTDGLKAP